MSLPSPEIVVAGAGRMAEEHLKALLAAGIQPAEIAVAARRRERAEMLAARYGVAGVGLADASASCAIVAVSENALVPVARMLVDRGAERVLVEKPGALTSYELASLAGDVHVAYNRRFYPSVARARELVEADGGPIALSFDFTEVEARVLAAGHPPETLARWGIANSSHVIDLAFHLAGDPVELHHERAGSLPWHPVGARFAGSGTTGQGALFSYLATWDGAGRWSVEVTTRERRLVLRPLEVLQQQLRGSFGLEPVAVAAEREGVKPGFAGQLAAFLGGEDARLCRLDEAVQRIRLAEQILGYDGMR